jgi:hypothetical protein
MDSWLRKIGQVAPSIATAFGGPLAGLAVKTIGGLFGLESPTEADLKALNPADPETQLKLREAENAFVIRLKELDIQLEEIDFKDRDSARQREMSVKDNVPAILASLSTLGYFGVIAAFMFFDLPAPSDLKNMILMGATSNYTLVLSYYFGSSHKKQADS